VSFALAMNATVELSGDSDAFVSPTSFFVNCFALEPSALLIQTSPKR